MEEKIVFQKIRDDWALFLFDGNEISLPKKMLPADIKKGDIVNIVLKNNAKETAAMEKSAKEILNEILHN